MTRYFIFSAICFAMILDWEWPDWVGELFTTSGRGFHGGGSSLGMTFIVIVIIALAIGAENRSK